LTTPQSLMTKFLNPNIEIRNNSKIQMAEFQKMRDISVWDFDLENLNLFRIDPYAMLRLDFVLRV